METTATLPTPLIQPMPLNAAVYYPDATRHHIYTENSQDRKNWAITTGPSQTDLFDHILQAMFASVDTLSTPESAPTGVDLVIIPTLKDIQFGLPSETKLTFYEVWMDYEVVVETPTGNAIAAIPLTGFGRAPKGYFSVDKDGLKNAANVAFRDAGAKLIVQFHQHPDIAKWLSTQPASAKGN